MLLIWNDDINIPGKLYDYLGTGKPIVAFADPQSEAWRLIEATRAGWCADSSSPRSIAELLTKVCESREHLLAEYNPDREAIRRCERPQRAIAYSNLLKEATKP